MNLLFQKTDFEIKFDVLKNFYDSFIDKLDYFQNTLNIRANIEFGYSKALKQLADDSFKYLKDFPFFDSINKYFIKLIASRSEQSLKLSEDYDSLLKTEFRPFSSDLKNSISGFLKDIQSMLF